MAGNWLDKLADALIPKEIAPYLGTAAALFAPQLGLPAAIAAGQLGSAKLNSGKLDPFQALAATGSYYGGGGQEIRARGENLTQRLGAGITGAKTGFGTPAGGFKGFTEGFSKGAGKVTGDGPMDRLLGTTYQKADYKQFLQDEATLNDLSQDIDKQFADGTITRDDYEIKQEALFEKAKIEGKINSTEIYEDFKDPRGLEVKAGDIFKGFAEGIAPGFAKRNSNGEIIPGTFDFENFVKTTGSVTTVAQMGIIAEEIKKANLKSKEEEAAVYRRYFEQYEGALPVDSEGNAQTYISHAGEYADPIMVKKYREYMAKGGIIGYSNGGMTRQRYNHGGGIGSIPQTPTVPEGMQLDGRGGGFIPMGAQEKKDDVPAMLAKNEFVLTADAMRGFDKANGGDGNPRDAAAKMYEIMSNYEAMA